MKKYAAERRLGYREDAAITPSSSPHGQAPPWAWQEYCGFLDLSLGEFLERQEELLKAQLDLIGRSPIGPIFLGSEQPATLSEFRRVVRLSRYEDYALWLKGRSPRLFSEGPAFWAYTCYRGVDKWVPYTRQAFERLLDYLLAAFMLACASAKGEVRVASGAKVLYNLAPRPYLTGYVVAGMAERFGLESLVPLESWESLDFQERIAVGFRLALERGVDIIGSLSSVLLKMGESLAALNPQEGRRGELTPAALLRYLRGRLRARFAGRELLPQDLWPAKGLFCWGLDTESTREKLRLYWGREPFQFHACTEAGVLAMQSWTKTGMTLVPDSVFLEFIPEAEWTQNRADPDYVPRTVLLDEVEPGQRYELVMTSFYGMPFLRYRPGHLFRVLAREDAGAGVALPQVIFVARADELIDVEGFTRLDEYTVAKALDLAGIRSRYWSVRAEPEDSATVLHFYLELGEETRPVQTRPTPAWSPGDEAEALEERIHHELLQCDPAYRDLDGMLGSCRPRVTLLRAGSFQRFYERQRERGAPLEELQPPRMNPSGEVVQTLLSLGGRE